MPIIDSGDAVFSTDKHDRFRYFKFIEQTGGKFCQLSPISRGRFCLCGITIRFESPRNGLSWSCEFKNWWHKFCYYAYELIMNIAKNFPKNIVLCNSAHRLKRVKGLLIMKENLGRQPIFKFRFLLTET